LENWYEYQVLAERPIASTWTCQPVNAMLSSWHYTYFDGPIDICTRECISFRDDFFILSPDFVLDTLGYIDPVLSRWVSPSPKEDRVIERITY